MTEDIKSRLEQIRAGKVPEGYIKTKAGIMPADWNVNERAREVFKSHTDKKHSSDMEILAATQESGIVPRSQIDIDIKCSDEGISGYKKVDAGDFIISLRSFQGGIEYSPYNGIVSPAYTVLKPIVKIADEYYKNYFKTESFISRLNGAVYGIRDGKQIGYEDFGNLIIHNPPLPEQQKIAEILMQCDKVIALKKERIEEEKKRKKWLMEKLFSVKYMARSTKRLRECVRWFGGGTPDKDEPQYWKHGTIKWVSSQEVKGLKVSETTYHITDRAVKESTTNIAPAYSLLLVTRSGILKRSLPIAYISEKMAINQDIKALVPRKEVNYYYLLSYLRYKEKEIVSSYVKTGTTVQSLIFNLFLNIKIPTPDYSAQELIAKALFSVDSMIDLLEAECKQWQQKKKALMQLLLTGIARVKL